MLPAKTTERPLGPQNTDAAVPTNTITPAAAGRSQAPQSLAADRQTASPLPYRPSTARSPDDQTAVPSLDDQTANPLSAVDPLSVNPLSLEWPWPPAVLLKGLEIPAAKYHKIDPAIWDDPLPCDRSTASRKQMTTFFAEKMTWAFDDEYDGNLWGSFYRTFEGWSEKDFKMVDNTYLQVLQRLLRRQGVYTGLKKSSIARRFADLVRTDRENAPEWPEEALLAEDFDQRTYAAERQREAQEKG